MGAAATPVHFAAVLKDRRKELVEGANTPTRREKKMTTQHIAVNKQTFENLIWFCLLMRPT